MEELAKLEKSLIREFCCKVGIDTDGSIRQLLNRISSANIDVGKIQGFTEDVGKQKESKTRQMEAEIERHNREMENLRLQLQLERLRAGKAGDSYCNSRSTPVMISQYMAKFEKGADIGDASQNCCNNTVFPNKTVAVDEKVNKVDVAFTREMAAQSFGKSNELATVKLGQEAEKEQDQSVGVPYDVIMDEETPKHVTQTFCKILDLSKDMDKSSSRETLICEVLGEGQLSDLNKTEKEFEVDREIPVAEHTFDEINYLGGEKPGRKEIFTENSTKQDCVEGKNNLLSNENAIGPSNGIVLQRGNKGLIVRSRVNLSDNVHREQNGVRITEMSSRQPIEVDYCSSWMAHLIELTIGKLVKAPLYRLNPRIKER